MRLRGAGKADTRSRRDPSYWSTTSRRNAATRSVDCRRNRWSIVYLPMVVDGGDAARSRPSQGQMLLVLLAHVGYACAPSLEL